MGYHWTIPDSANPMPAYRRERSKSLEVITNSLSIQGAKKYNWLEWDNSEMTGKLINLPPRADIPENINEQLIVELYSK